MTLMQRRKALMAGAKTEDPGWKDGVKYDWVSGLISNTYIDTSGKQVAYNGWSSTDYLPCKGVVRMTRGSAAISNYCAFYDNDKRFIKRAYFNVDVSQNVPNNAYYLRVSAETSKMTNLATYYIIPHAE